jgi:acyl phosphate:glycerol-3-phosphate acyltransferase
MWAVLILPAYLLGTFPSADVVARASGVDITTAGSGNPGASNVTRVLGWRKGVLVFALDAAKGAIATLVGLWAGGWDGGPADPRVAGYALGAAAILGHVFPVTRRFRGGKGVATGGGVMAVLHPAAVAALAVVWLLVSRLTGRASVASIACIALFPIGLAITGAPAWEFGATVALAALVLARHAGNVARLLRGGEPSLTRQTP